MFVLAVLVIALLALVCDAAGSTQTINALYPKNVGNMYLRGSGCGLNWDKGVLMNRTPESEGFKWSYAVNCDASVKDNLEVKVLVNDQTWMIGSNALVSTASSNSHDVYPWFYTYAGTLQIVNNVYSKELNNFRDVIYYLPPSYNENTLKKHSNVLIMHDGQNLFNPATSAYGTAWMCQNTLDSTIVGGQTEEILIVGAYNTADRMNEYTYVYDPSEGTGGKGDLYLDWIESTLIPTTQKNFRVNIQREKLGILGSSLGGLISCYAGWTRSTVYGKVGCMSSSFWWDSNDFQNNILVNNNPSDTVPLPHIYMDSGTAPEEKSCTLYTTQVYNYMLGDGFVANQTVFQYVDEGGSHSESSWGPRFYIPVEDLYPVTPV